MVVDAMSGKLLEILEREAKVNQERLNTFTENLDIASFLAESPEQKLMHFQDEILEARYNVLFPEKIKISSVKDIFNKNKLKKTSRF